jgi:hypothetical protein
MVHWGKHRFWQRDDPYLHTGGKATHRLYVLVEPPISAPDDLSVRYEACPPQPFLPSLL